MKFEIKAINALKDNYIWLVKNLRNGTAICIDPSEATPVINECQQQNLTLAAILITHHHWDHTGGVADLSQQFGCSVYGPSKESIAGITHKVEYNDVLSFDNLSFTVIETPGHTVGHVCYYGNNLLFCGDTLFTCGCGRVFEGTAKQMFDSLEQLKTLPDETQVYCAHEYTVHNLQFARLVEPENVAIKERLNEALKLRQHNKPTVPSLLGLEKSTNPFLRCEVEEVRLAAEAHVGRELLDPVDVFTVIRKWKDSF